MSSSKLAEIMTDRCRKSFEDTVSEYTYSDNNGSVIYDMLSDLNEKEVVLHDVITKNVFKGVDYYRLISLAPLWVRDVGHSQEGAMSKEEFEKLVNLNNNELTHKFLYYHDCEMLMSAFQNRTQVIGRLMNRIYEHLTPNLNRHIKEYEDFGYGIGDEGVDVYTYINSLIITLASSFDLLTKVAYELQEMSKVSFDKYPEQKSASITYGKKKWLRDNLKVASSLFDENEPVCVRQIESLRDEIIHNGSLDFHYSLYHGLIDGKVEQLILFPDMTENGRLVSFNQRKKFYPDCQRTFNKMLPPIVIDVIHCLSVTMDVLISEFECEWEENEREIRNYQEEILGWSGLRMDEEGLIHADWLKEGLDAKHQDMLLKMIEDTFGDIQEKSPTNLSPQN